MKKLQLWSIILIVSLVSSCTHDNSEIGVQHAIDASAKYSNKGSNYVPENSANEFDIAGVLYCEVTQAFIELDTLPGDVSGTIPDVEQLAQKNLKFFAILPLDYCSPFEHQISFAVGNQQNTMVDIIEKINISRKAKTSLQDFIETVMLFREDEVEYEVMYDYIIDFETDVVQDLDYSFVDRKVILTTTSIARHGLHFRKKKKKPRDRDWEISWGSIAAGSQGSAESTSKAVIMSVVTGVHLNH